MRESRRNKTFFFMNIIVISKVVLRLRGLENGSVARALVTKVRGPEFESQSLVKDGQALRATHDRSTQEAETGNP